MTTIQDKSHAVKNSTPALAEVHLNGIIFTGIEVDFDPDPRYEDGRVHAKIKLRSEDMELLVEELYHSRDDVYVEIYFPPFGLVLDDTDHHEHRFDTERSGTSYVRLGGWVDISWDRNGD